MGSPFSQVQGACEEKTHPRGRGLEETGLWLDDVYMYYNSLILIYVLFKSSLLALETIGYSLDILY